MTTIICDLSVDWNGCPYCSMLKGCVESAESTCRAASERLDQAYAGYRSEREAGRAAIGTGQWSVWQDRLRYLSGRFMICRRSFLSRPPCPSRR